MKSITLLTQSPHPPENDEIIKSKNTRSQPTNVFTSYRVEKWLTTTQPFEVEMEKTTTITDCFEISTRKLF